MLTTLATTFDLLILAFAFGATTWFFFVQTPVLLRWKGKEKFIPIQMRLTRSLFAALAVAVPVMFGLTLVHGSDYLWLHTVTAGVAMFGALANHFVVVPRALRAGGEALREVRGTETDDSISDFASRGGGDASKTWHRLVVVFVVVMLGGLVAHGAVMVHGPEHVHASIAAFHEGHHGEHGHAVHEHGTHEHAHGQAADNVAKPAVADAATKRNVQELHHVVREGLEQPGEISAADVRSAYQTIFDECRMVGADHDQLHHFLVPIGVDINDFESGDDNALVRLDEKLSEFETQFR